MLEIHDLPPRVGETAVVQNLEQEIKDLWVRLFNLIKQDNAIGASMYRLGQLTCLIIADIAWRSADEPGDMMALHKLGHIQLDQRVLIAKEPCGQRQR